MEKITYQEARAAMEQVELKGAARDLQGEDLMWANKTAKKNLLSFDATKTSAIAAGIRSSGVVDLSFGDFMNGETSISVALSHSRLRAVINILKTADEALTAIQEVRQRNQEPQQESK